MIIFAWILLLSQLVLGIFLLYLVIAFLTGAPYVPTTRPGTASMMRLAQIKKGETVVDLGSGDGRLLMEAARRGAGKAIGSEINPFLVLLSNLRARYSPYREIINTYWQNLWHTDISDADVIFVYLIPWKMKKLERKIMKEARPGTRIVSNSFVFPGLARYGSDGKTHIYAFRR